MFCGPQLYTAPYGTKEGGWFGLVLLFLYCGFTFGSCYYIGLVITDTRLITTYPDIGKIAYGKRGAYLVTVCVHSYVVVLLFLKQCLLTNLVLFNFFQVTVCLLSFVSILYMPCLFLLTFIYLDQKEQ